MPANCCMLNCCCE